MKICLPLIATLLLTATSCMGRSAGKELKAPPAALKHECVASGPTDSLGFYLGKSEGEAIGEFLKGAPEWMVENIDRDQYLSGLESALQTDTVTLSYTDGVQAARVLAHYINTLEHSGVTINRTVMARHLKELVETRNPISDQRAETADSITNKLITECLGY